MFLSESSVNYEHYTLWKTHISDVLSPLLLNLYFFQTTKQMKIDKTAYHLCFLGVACHEISSIWNSCVSLQMTLPWGSLSSLKLDCRSQSDDGPIMWVRPGEQMVPTADMPKSPFKRRRYNSICTEIRSDTAQKSYHLKWLQKFRFRTNN